MILQNNRVDIRKLPSRSLWKGSACCGAAPENLPACPASAAYSLLPGQSTEWPKTRTHTSHTRAYTHTRQTKFRRSTSLNCGLNSSPACIHQFYGSLESWVRWQKWNPREIKVQHCTGYESAWAIHRIVDGRHSSGLYLKILCCKMSISFWGFPHSLGLTRTMEGRVIIIKLIIINNYKDWPDGDFKKLAVVLVINNIYVYLLI